MKLNWLEYAGWAFVVTFPAFLSAGGSQLPLWPVLVIIYAARLNAISVYGVLILFVFMIGFFLESIAIGHLEPIALYRVQVLLSLLVSFLLMKNVAQSDLLIILGIAVTINLILAIFELLIPSICDYMHFVNRVRSCVPGRPSGAYNEPSHIAFLVIITALSLSKVSGRYLVLKMLTTALAILCISGTLIVGAILLIGYRLIPLPYTLRVVIMSVFLLAGNISYLELRLNEVLPSQQSYDKRTSYTSMFLISPNLLPSFTRKGTNAEFYQDFRYEEVMRNNEEIKDGYAAQKVASLSILGTLYFTLGLPLSLIFTVVFLGYMRKSKDLGYVLILWLGFPAALAVLPLMLSMIRGNTISRIKR